MYINFVSMRVKKIEKSTSYKITNQKLWEGGKKNNNNKKTVNKYQKNGQPSMAGVKAHIF